MGKKKGWVPESLPGRRNTPPWPTAQGIGPDAPGAEVKKDSGGQEKIQALAHYPDHRGFDQGPSGAAAENVRGLSPITLCPPPVFKIMLGPLGLIRLMVWPVPKWVGKVSYRHRKKPTRSPPPEVPHQETGKKGEISTEKKSCRLTKGGRPPPGGGKRPWKEAKSPAH